MTTPTQAQIEVKLNNLIDDPNSASGKRIDPDAAAEVGEKDKAVDAFNSGYKQAWENATAATIERCAQWLEDDGNHATAREMRRALKDKP